MKIRHYVFFVLVVLMIFLLSCSGTNNINVDEIRQKTLIELYDNYKNNTGYNESFDKWLVDLNSATFDNTKYTVYITGEKSIYVGFGTQLYITTIPCAEGTLIWKSLDNDVATVSNNGFVYGVKSGTTYITVENDDSSLFACYVIEVKDEPDVMVARNLGGYIIKVMTPASQLSDIDPFSDNYIKPDKSFKQEALRDVEVKYNCKIEFISLPVNDKTVFQNLKDSIKYDEYLCDICYTNIENAPAFINSDLIIDTTVYKEKYGYVDNGNITYDDLYFDGRYYGLSDNNTNYLINGLLFNVRKIEELGIPNPSKLFNEGNWNYSNFEKWLENAKSKYDKDTIICSNPLSIYYGLIDSDGRSVSEKDYSLNLRSLYDVYEFIIRLCKNGYIIFDNYVSYKNNDFCRDNALMMPCNVESINYLFESTSGLFADDTEFGFVPYPYPDNTNKSNAKIGYSYNLGYMFVNNNLDNGVNGELIYQIFYDYLVTTVKKENDSAYSAKSYDYLRDIKKLDEESIKAIMFFDSTRKVYDPCLYFVDDALNDSLIKIFKEQEDISFIFGEPLSNYYNMLDRYKKESISGK